MPSTLVQIEHLSVDAVSEAETFPAVRDVTLDIRTSEALALVGESGSGKTLTALSIAGLLAENLRPRGSITFQGREVLGLPWRERRALAGSEIGYIFQEPMSALHPILTVGEQIEESLKAHFTLSRQERADRVRDLLTTVGLAKSRDVASNRIGQLSGGMRQRVMIAIAISCGPSLLIADEPTTALDVTLQKQIMDLLVQLREEMGLTLLLITHNLALVAQTCDRAAVLYAGQVVEVAPTKQLLGDPRHGYTKALVTCSPVLDDIRRRLPTVSGTAPWLVDERALPSSRWDHHDLLEIEPGRWLRGHDGMGGVA